MRLLSNIILQTQSRLRLALMALTMGPSLAAHAEDPTASPFGYLWRLRVTEAPAGLEGGEIHTNNSFVATNWNPKNFQRFKAEIIRTARGPKTGTAAAEIEISAEGQYFNGSRRIPEGPIKPIKCKASLVRPEGLAALDDATPLPLGTTPKCAVSGDQLVIGSFVITVGSWRPEPLPAALNGKANVLLRAFFQLDDQTIFRIKEEKSVAPDGSNKVVIKGSVPEATSISLSWALTFERKLVRLTPSGGKSYTEMKSHDWETVTKQEQPEFSARVTQVK